MVSISIVIPVYNVEKYIGECLQSVIRQTYTGPLECVLVDDCGTDKSIEVAEKLIADYEGLVRFKVLRHECNRGLSAARNTGMDAATNEYVYFLDSDDWISDDCIEKLVKPLQQERYDIVVGGYETVGATKCLLELRLPEGRYHENRISKVFCNQGVYVMAWNKLYCKDFLVKNQLRFAEGKIYEDEILAFELSCIELTFYVVKSVTYYYRIRENSIVTDGDYMKKLIGYVGILHSVKEKVNRYKDVCGIYDFYMYWVKRVFGWVTKIELNGEMLEFVQEHSKGTFDVIPGVCFLHNKHNRLIYYSCKKDQRYLRYQYVTKEYANMIQGRLLRNLLDLLPVKN